MASQDIARLIVSLEARTKAFENALNRANGVAKKQARAIESRFAAMNKRVSSTLAGVGRGWVAGIAAGISVREAKQLVDSATRIDNALKVAGLSGAELEKVYQRLKQSAMDNAAPIEALTELYGRAALVQKELGISGAELLNFTDKIAVALRVSGKSAAESSGALLQLSQALGSGVVRAEEFNSILEGALPIAQAAAAGLKEAGGSVAKLRQLVVDGKVSSEAFFRAFEAGSPILEEKVSGAVLTIDQRLGNLRTSLIDAARRFNTSSQAANTFGEAIDNVADFVNGIDFDGLIDEISRLIEQFAAGIKAANDFARSVARASGLDYVGEGIVQGLNDLGVNTTGVITSDRIMDKRLGRVGAAGASGGFTDAEMQAFIARNYGGANPANPKTGRLPAATGGKGFTPVSLDDYAAPDAGSSKKGGGRSRKDELQREIEQIRERTAALQAETAALAGLNPLVDDYGYSVTKARASAELLTAAQKAGIAITPELKAQIDALAEGYATATVEANKLAESQERARQTAEEMRSLGKDVLGGFIRDLREGKSGAEALANALDKVVDKLIDVAINSIFDGGGKGGGGLFGGLFSGIGKLFGFADGGIAAHGKPGPLKKFARGGVSRSAAIFGEAGPEAAVPLPDGRRIPVDLRVPKVNGAQGGDETIRVVLQDDSGRMADIADRRIRTASGTIVQVSVQQSLKATQQIMPGLLASTQARHG